MFKRIIALIPPFFLSIAGISAQEINIRWSRVFPEEVYIKEGCITFTDSLWNIYFLTLENNRFFNLDKFDAEFNKKWSKVFKYQELTGTQESKYLFEYIAFKHNRFECIVSYKNSRKKTLELIAFRIDTSGAVIGTPLVLHSMSEINPRKTFYSIQQTPSFNKKIIITGLNNSPKENQFIINYLVTDSSFQTQSENELVIPVSLNMFDWHQFSIDDSLNIFISGFEYIKGEKFREAPYKYVFFTWINNLGIIRKSEFDLGNQFMLGSISSRFNTDSLLVCGLYGKAFGNRNQWTDSETRGLFTAWLSNDGNLISPVRLIPIETLSLPPYFDFKKQVPHSIARYSDGEFALISRHTFTYCYNSSCTYSSDAVLVFHFDRTGNISWVNGIDKKQRQLNSGAYISHVNLLANDTLFFFYNDSRKNSLAGLKKRDIFNPKTDKGDILCKRIFKDGSDIITVLNNDDKEPYLLIPNRCSFADHDMRSLILISSRSSGFQRYDGMRIGILKF